ncbi:MAG: hypothetical protein JSS07_11420 [Proteobacteria bacterium]|nr:hypothetical protein [Pseudomonadota bacterium]
MKRGIFDDTETENENVAKKRRIATLTDAIENTTIALQDNIIISEIAGEFRQDTANISDQRTRLYSYIETIITHTANKHKKDNCNLNGELKTDKSHFVTRAITNEFSFFTKQPLTLEEFEELFVKIADLAEKQPQNLHFILSSFAVRLTPGVINVAAYIECGPKLKINFIVKNYLSTVDPVYYEMQKAKKVVVPSINVRCDISAYCFSIKNEIYNFTFNNIVECNTACGKQFLTCIDICFDHFKGVAKNNLLQKISLAEQNQDFFPKQCSHVITSHTIDRVADNVVGTITHADKSQNIHLETIKEINNIPFGVKTTRKLIEIPARICLLAPEFLNRVQNINSFEKVSSNKAISLDNAEITSFTPYFDSSKLTETKQSEKSRIGFGTHYF